MGVGDLNLGVSLRLRGLVWSCWKTLLWLRAGFDTSHRSDSRLCWKPFGQTKCDNYTGVPEDVSGLLSPSLLLGNDIQLSTDNVVHVSLTTTHTATSARTFRLNMGKRRPRAPCSDAEPHENSLALLFSSSSGV